MSELSEGPPLEPIEKNLSNVTEIASDALGEIKNVYGPEEISTQALTDLRIWLRDAAQNSPEADENIVKIMYSLRDAHIAMDDEKASVREKINDITEILDQFISNPNKFKVEHDDLVLKLMNFCEILSQ